MLMQSQPYQERGGNAQHTPPGDDALSLQEWQSIVREALNQAPWRAQADMEADYADGNQLDSDLLRRQQKLGIPPAKENIIGPAIAAVCGYEAKTRTDWRVTPDGDPGGQVVADALNFRLNQAERHSKADRALSEAFALRLQWALAGWRCRAPVIPSSFPIGAAMSAATKSGGT